MITIVGVSFGDLITGAVLTETIFSWNGIGTYAVESSRSLDFPAIIGVSARRRLHLPAVQPDHRHRYADRRPADPLVVTLASRSPSAAAAPRPRARRLRRPAPLCRAARPPSCRRGDRGRLAAGDPVRERSWPRRTPSPPPAPGCWRRPRTACSAPTPSAATCSPGCCGAPVSRCRWRCGDRDLGPGRAARFGAIAGSSARVHRRVLMRFVDITMAFPPILLAMAITASLGPNLSNALIAMVLVWWPIYARLMRGQILSLKNASTSSPPRAIGARPAGDPAPTHPAARAHAGARQRHDGPRHDRDARRLAELPRSRRRPPSPEWGAMITEGSTNFYQWWIAAGPGLAIVSSCWRSISSATDCGTSWT